MANFNLAELFMDTVYADIIFVVDNKEIPGHRLVLAKTCPYFDKLLFGNFQESKSNKVVINGTSAKVFTEVMRYTYKVQLEVKEWTIEDLMSLLAVAHEYQFQSLVSAVIKAVELAPLNFDSWPLVSSAASVYDSEELQRKSTSFAEEKIEDFIRGKDLEKFSAEFICCMFNCPKMSSFNHDHVLKAICNWKKGRSSCEIVSVMQKINWEDVSPSFKDVILRELLFAVKNVEDCEFWTKLSADIEGPFGSHASNNRILRVDSVVLKGLLEMKFALPYCDSNIFCRFLYNCIELWFQKDANKFEIPVKRIEFETETKFKIEKIYGYHLKGGSSSTMAVVTKSTSNVGWFKYDADFSDSKHVFIIRIFSQDFRGMHEISLRNIIMH